MTHRALLLGGFAGLFTAGDVPLALACLRTLGALAERDGFTPHQLELFLDELGLAVVDDDVRETLIGSGLATQREQRLVVDLESVVQVEMAYGVFEAVPVAALLDILDDSATATGAAFSPTRIAPAIDRVVSWATTLVDRAAEPAWAGFGVFWDRNDPARSEPFGLDVGSMAATDTILLATEPSRWGWASPESSAGLTRAVERLIALGFDEPGDWYDGAIHIQDFDDDFVGTFDPGQAARGSCPTTEATANRASGLVALARHPALAAGVRDAARSAGAAAVRCVLRWQADGGLWAIHRYRGDEHELPLSDVSTQYAAEALLEALHDNDLPDELRAEVRSSLRRLADAVSSLAVHDDVGVHWQGDFVLGDAASQLRTTTLMALILGRIAQTLDDPAVGHLQSRAVDHVLAHWSPAPADVFVREFRSPTWSGAALNEFAWDMVRDGFVVSAVTDEIVRTGAQRPDAEERLVEGVAGILDSEIDGSWLDIPMAREGNRRAFVSNSLHNLRALLNAGAWVSSSIPVGVRPVGGVVQRG